MRSSLPTQQLRPRSDWFDANSYDPEKRREEMARNPETQTARMQRYIRYVIGGALTLGVFQVITYAYVQASLFVSNNRSDASIDLPTGADVADASAATSIPEQAVPAPVVAAVVSEPAAGPAPAPEQKRRVIPRFSLTKPWEPVYVRAADSGAVEP
jgi:hypothetical protein